MFDLSALLNLSVRVAQFICRQSRVSGGSYRPVTTVRYNFGVFYTLLRSIFPSVAGLGWVAARAAGVLGLVLLALCFNLFSTSSSSAASCPGASGPAGTINVTYYLTAGGCGTTDPGSGVIATAQFWDAAGVVIFTSVNVSSSTTTGPGCAPCTNTFGPHTTNWANWQVGNPGGETFVTTATFLGGGQFDFTEIEDVNGNATSIGPVDFSVVTPAPTVTGISPTTGPTSGGTSVTITGINFTGATSVMFGNPAATNVVVVNDTTITATTPANVGNPVIHVTTPAGTGEKRGLFTYVAPGVPPDIFGKSFGAASIAVGGSTSLGFIISNNNNAYPLTGLAFTDTLPAGLVIATPNSLSNSCAGTITAVAGSNSVTYSGGTVNSGFDCGFSVNVTATVVGTQNNTTSTITSNEAPPGAAATASIIVTGLPASTVTGRHRRI